MSNALIYEWRQLLKRYLLNERDWKSDLSGKKITVHTGCHLHEGIASRAVVPKSVEWHYKIYHPINCFLLLPEEHIPQPPSKEWAIAKATELYGIDTVRNWWYNELNWKNGPPFVLYEEINNGL